MVDRSETNTWRVDGLSFIIENLHLRLPASRSQSNELQAQTGDAPLITRRLGAGQMTRTHLPYVTSQDSRHGSLCHSFLGNSSQGCWPLTALGRACLTPPSLMFGLVSFSSIHDVLICGRSTCLPHQPQKFGAQSHISVAPSSHRQNAISICFIRSPAVCASFDE